jgi:hypothetical protein
VFTFGSLLVAIRAASGQSPPRTIATTLLHDDVIRYTVGLFVPTLLFALKALYRIESHVPPLVVRIAAIPGLFTLVAFLVLIDYTARPGFAGARRLDRYDRTQVDRLNLFQNNEPHHQSCQTKT